MPLGTRIMPGEPAAIQPLNHRLHTLTTYELKDRRRELERAITGIAPGAPVQAALRRQLDAVIAEQEDRARPPVPDLHRAHDVTGLSSGDLERVRRELTASLALTRPGSPARVPILAQMSAIDTELSERAAERPGT
jgi:hypothetical protein